MKKISSVLLVLVLVCSLFVSCGGNKAATTPSVELPTQTAGTSTEAGNVKSAEIQKDVKYKDTVIIGVENDITTLDPQGSNTDANMMAFYLMHERLVNVDPDTNEIIPGLAESWTVSEDGCTYVFTLPANVTFTDGSKFSAEDVKYTLDKAKESSFQSAKVTDVKEVTVLDDTHVQIVLAKANQDWITLMAHGGMSILSKAACEKDPVTGPYLGTGMFKLDEWKPGDFVSFVRYDGYRNGPAPTKKIVLKLYKEASTRLIALQTGEIDVCIGASTTDLERIKSDANLDLIQCPDVVLVYIPMQMQRPGLDNVHVRRALAYCADKESMVIGGKDGLAIVHNNYINRGQFGLNPDIHVYEFNIEKAKEELALSGYKPGELTFRIMTDKEWKKTMALIFQNACAQIGINIVIDERETASLKSTLNDAALDYDMCIYQFTDDLGTDYTLRNQCGGRIVDGKRVKMGSNRPNMVDEKFDALIDAALVETDVEKRRQMYYDAENYLDEVCPLIPICTGYINIGAKKGLAGAVWKPDAKHDFRFIALPE